MTLQANNNLVSRDMSREYRFDFMFSEKLSSVLELRSHRLKYAFSFIDQCLMVYSILTEIWLHFQRPTMCALCAGDVTRLYRIQVSQSRQLSYTTENFRSTPMITGND